MEKTRLSLVARFMPWHRTFGVIHFRLAKHPALLLPPRARHFIFVQRGKGQACHEIFLLYILPVAFGVVAGNLYALIIKRLHDKKELEICALPIGIF